MALLDTQCDQCDAITEIVRRAAEFGTALPACSTCGGSVQIIALPPRTTWSIDPVVVYKTPDGSFRFPGSTDGAAAANYSKLGYERVELRSAADVRRFESHMNKREREQAIERVEAMHQDRDAKEHDRRSGLFHEMKSMSRRGREIARAAIASSNRKHAPEHTRDVGFHVESFSYDRSNREAARGNDGRRRRD